MAISAKIAPSVRPLTNCWVNWARKSFMRKACRRASPMGKPDTETPRSSDEKRGVAEKARDQWTAVLVASLCQVKTTNLNDFRSPCASYSTLPIGGWEGVLVDVGRDLGGVGVFGSRHGVGDDLHGCVCGQLERAVDVALLVGKGFDERGVGRVFREV